MQRLRSLLRTAAPAIAVLVLVPSATASSWDWDTSLADYESRMESAVSPSSRFAWLDSAAFSAVMAGNLEKAKGYADEALMLAPSFRNEWSYGNAIHHGHLVLGHLALLDGDVKTAEKELLTAGKIDGSPQLDTFGPNMALAKALLEKGRREVVLAYFEECRKFWGDYLHELDTWKAAVEKGEIPDFGPNLLY